MSAERAVIVPMAAIESDSSNKGPSWTQILLDDYELQVGPALSRTTRDRVEKDGPTWFCWLVWDFALCYFLLGSFVVVFWRSAWYSAEYAFDVAFEARQH